MITPSLLKDTDAKQRSAWTLQRPFVVVRVDPPREEGCIPAQAQTTEGAPFRGVGPCPGSDGQRQCRLVILQDEPTLHSPATGLLPTHRTQMLSPDLDDTASLTPCPHPLLAEGPTRCFVLTAFSLFYLIEEKFPKSPPPRQQDH